MKIEFTSAERVIWKMTYEFAVNVEKLTPEQAREKAMGKIIAKRVFAKKVVRH
jgi:hypothetical protein